MDGGPGQLSYRRQRAEFLGRHRGASGIVYGLDFFMFISGLIRGDKRLLAITLLVTFLYGSLVWGILPVDQSVSWESHLFGSVAGLLAALYYRKEGPAREKYSWELEEEQAALEGDEQPGEVPYYKEGGWYEEEDEENR